jgi:hypothetical protein
MTVIASAVGESAGTVGVSGALKLMELAGGTLKVTEVLAPRPKSVNLHVDPARYQESKSESARRRATRGSCDFVGFLVPGPMTRSSRNRLKAVVDLIFDALPDLVVAHVRIFQ